MIKFVARLTWGISYRLVSLIKDKIKKSGLRAFFMKPTLWNNSFIPILFHLSRKEGRYVKYLSGNPMNVAFHGGQSSLLFEKGETVEWVKKTLTLKLYCTFSLLVIS